jgi:DNA-directed RNA polymerase subunit K/omega
MTYIRRKDVTEKIENKFEAIKVMALESRRLNDRARSVGIALPGKLTSIAIRRLINGEIEYYDQRERAAELLEEEGE